MKTIQLTSPYSDQVQVSVRGGQQRGPVERPEFPYD